MLNNLNKSVNNSSDHVMSRRTAEAVSAVVLFNLLCHMDAWKWSKHANLKIYIQWCVQQVKNHRGIVYRLDLFFFRKKDVDT